MLASCEAIGSVRYCTVFSFIILLYCESYERIYISPICDVLTHYFSEEIRKLGILFFLSSHGIRARRENLIFG